MIILNSGYTVSVPIANGESLRVESRGGTTVSAVSGLGVTGVLGTVDGTRDFGPYTAGVVSIAAVGGDCSYSVLPKVAVEWNSKLDALINPVSGASYPISRKTVTLPDVYASDVTRTITVPNPYRVGNLSVVHAKIVCAPSGFGGYKYWLTATPFNDGGTQYENPCVWASNDLVTWATPATNPIVPVPATGFNSDTSFVFSPDGRILYLIYREHPVNSTNIKVLHTTDGVSWSTPQTILSGLDATPQDLGSPSLVWNKVTSKWEVYTINLAATDPNPMHRAVSSTSDVYGAWGAPALIDVPYTASKTGWHCNFIRDADNILFGAFTETDLNQTDREQRFFVVVSTNNVLFTKIALDVPVRAYLPSIFLDEFGDVKLLASYVTAGESFRVIDLISKSDYDAIRDKRSDQLNGLKFSIVRDSFNRANSATTMGNTDNGLAWFYSAANSAGISGNAAYNVATNTRALVTTSASDGYIEMDIEQVGTGGVAALIRAVNGEYIRVGFNSDTDYRLYYDVYSAFASVSTANINQPLPPAGRKLGIRFEGPSFKFYLDGCLIGTATIPNYLTQTNHGMQMNGATPAKVASFLFVPLSDLDVRFDDTKSGAILASADATTVRALNTTYTNKSGKGLLVSASARCVVTTAAGSATIQGKSDALATPTTAVSPIVGIQSGLLNEDNTVPVSFIVAPGKNYRIDSAVANGTATLGSWFETTL